MAEIPTSAADLIDCPYAVAGHEGTLSNTTGELFIKPCTDAEIAFYNESIAYHEDFYYFMPTFMGTLTLDEDQSKSIEEKSAEFIANSSLYAANRTKRIVTNQALVLENASHGFVKPNILDVKLGVRLWADDAAQTKKDRFNIVTEDSTHKNLGFRIAGMRVWQGPGATGPNIDKEGYRIYNKDYGRHLKDKDVHQAFKDFIFTESAGIDNELGQLVSQCFHHEVEKIQQALENQESRMYSASLLFVFEGDGIALRSAMEEASKVNGHASSSSGDTTASSDDEEELGPKVYAVKVIDFAHAKWTPKEGPDTNALKGVRSVAEILGELAYA